MDLNPELSEPVRTLCGGGVEELFETIERPWFQELVQFTAMLVREVKLTGVLTPKASKEQIEELRDLFTNIFMAGPHPGEQVFADDIEEISDALGDLIAAYHEALDENSLSVPERRLADLWRRLACGDEVIDEIKEAVPLPPVLTYVLWYCRTYGAVGRLQ